MRLDPRAAALMLSLFPLVACLGAADRVEPELARLTTALEQGGLAAAGSALKVLERTVNSLDLETLTSKDASAIEAHFFTEIGRNPGVAAIRLADEAGNFIRVWREPDGSISTKLIVRAAYGSPTSRTVLRRPGAALESALQNRLDPTDSYDPRGKDWYEATIVATAPVWLPASAADEAAGRTVCLSFRRDGGVAGAVAVEVDAAGFAELFGSLQPKQGWRAYLLNEAGGLLASAGAGAADDKFLKALLAAPELAAVRAGADTGKGQMQADAEQAAFGLRRIVIAAGPRWVVAVIAPTGAAGG